jgi:hypothetical protein
MDSRVAPSARRTLMLLLRTVNAGDKLEKKEATLFAPKDSLECNICRTRLCQHFIQEGLLASSREFSIKGGSLYKDSWRNAQAAFAGRREALEGMD